VAQGVAEAERERELSKQALAAQVNALEARVRRQLDWRAKLRGNRLRYAVIGTVALVVATSVLVIRARWSEKETPEVTIASLDDVARELREIKSELAKHRKDSGPIWQKLAVKAAGAAAAGAGGVAARKAMEQFGMTGEPGGG
jgi:hypothetical protein